MTQETPEQRNQRFRELREAAAQEMKMIKYLIINESEQAFWSNENGWGDFIDATRFEEVETEICFLPADSKWITEEEAKSYKWITEEDED